MKKQVKSDSTRNPALLVRIPPALQPKLKADAAAYGCSEQAMLLWIAGQYYGLAIDRIPLGRPPKKAEG